MALAATDLDRLQRRRHRSQGTDWAVTSSTADHPRLVCPVWILPLLIPLEFLSNILIRPVTLSLRLFANMFAGHLLLLLFATGGADYMLIHATGPQYILKPAGILSFVLGIAGRASSRWSCRRPAGVRVHAACRLSTSPARWQTSTETRAPRRRR